MNRFSFLAGVLVRMVESGSSQGLIALVPVVQRAAERRIPSAASLLSSAESQVSPAYGAAVDDVFSAMIALDRRRAAELALRVVSAAREIDKSADDFRAFVRGGMAAAAGCLALSRVFEAGAWRVLARLREQCPPECEDEQGHCYCWMCQRAEEELERAKGSPVIFAPSVPR